MKDLWVVHGKGRCVGTIVYVRAMDEHDARERLLREDASPYFQIDRVEPLAVWVHSLIVSDKIMRAPIIDSTEDHT